MLFVVINALIYTKLVLRHTCHSNAIGTIISNKYIELKNSNWREADQLATRMTEELNLGLLRDNSTYWIERDSNSRQEFKCGPCHAATLPPHVTVSCKGVIK